MARLKLNNISSFGLTNLITFANGSTTTGTWMSSPPFPTIAANDYAAIVVEADTANEEIVYLWGPWTAGATSATTFTRAQEGTTGIAHSATVWLHGPTALDSPPAGLGVYGDGSDGAILWDGTTTRLSMVPSGSTYTLTRDVFLNGSTINSGVTIITNGYRIFDAGTLTNNGTIQWNGNAGSGATGGAAINNTNASINASTSSSGSPGTKGGNGSTSGAGAIGTAATTVGFGGAGGAGGAGAAGGGIAGTLTTPAAGQSPPRALPYAVMVATTNSGATTTIAGGTGGGGGSGDGTHAAGSGGGGGGLVMVAARAISGTGTISANGGAGSNAATSGTNSGGGGGGGGGVVIVISSSVSGGAISGQTITASGGAFGTKLGTGSNGVVGSAGLVILIPN